MEMTTVTEKITRSGFGFHDFKRKSSTSEFPTAFVDYIRSYGEVYFWEKGNFHVITKALHAKEILTSDAFSADRGSFFVSRMPNLDLRLIGDFFGVVKKMMVMSDDNEHTMRRKAAASGFEDKVLEQFTSKLEESVKSLVLSIKNRHQFDFVEDVAKKLPSMVLADLFSIPEKDRENFLKWSNIMTGFFGGASEYRIEDGIEVNDSALSLKTYFTGLVAERRNNPGRDYVSIILSMQHRFNLTDDEVISQLIMMLVAGMATTTDQLGNIMFLLASNPEIQSEVRANPNLIPKMIEELKRFDPAVTFIFRVARKETTISGQPIKVGDVVFISTHAINRDLPESERPEELNIHRNFVNLSYGHGPHYCIGAKLARMEMKSLFEVLLKQLPPIHLDEMKNSERDHYSLSFSGFKTLYLRTV
jgi:cytochrome P450